MNWITSHISIRGNEWADSLAKSATNFENHDIHQIPYTDFFETFRNEAIANTEQKTIEKDYSVGKKYFQLY